MRTEARRMTAGLAREYLHEQFLLLIARSLIHIGQAGLHR